MAERVVEMGVGVCVCVSVWEIIMRLCVVEE